MSDFVIHKIQLPASSGEYTLDALPADAEILHIAEQQGAITFWYSTYGQQMTQGLKVKIIYTGEHIYNINFEDQFMYLKTLEIVGLVYHIFIERTVDIKRAVGIPMN